MKVCIAEKPSVAREIAAVLGAQQKHEGYYEGGGYQVTWTFGHLCTLFSPEDYKPHWKRWDLNTLPMSPERFEIKLTKDPGAQRQFQTVKKLFGTADVVINCGDAGQEGELIQRWVMKQANYKGAVQRLWISSLTPEAIKAGFENLKDARAYDYLYHAGSSRAIGDWLLGINATRLYTLRYAAQKQVLSVGRVQTPTLAMLVNRHKAIAGFKPSAYWELKTRYRETVFQEEQGRFTKQEEAQKALSLVREVPFEVVSVQKKKAKEYAPKLFDLTGLQVYCNTKFGYTADQTLKIVQKLYEQKLVTYPRVDTTFLPEDLYPKIHGILSRLSAYKKWTAPLLGHEIKKSSSVFNTKKVTDHHAIIPTGVETVLGELAQKVYDSIVRRFVAAFYPDCQVSNTSVVGCVAKFRFKATGKEILEEGWRVVFQNPKDLKVAQTAEPPLPAFEKGESGSHTPSLAQKETKAPKNFTEASLLRAMETAGKEVEDDALRELMKANGIGRPSTRANIIETLFKRRYVVRKKKLILPTQMGIHLIETIQNKLLKSPELTGQWEKQLKEIEQGVFPAARFISNMKKMVDDLVVEVRMEKNIRRFSEASDTSKKAIRPKANPSLDAFQCPKCLKGKLLKGNTAYGCSEYQLGCGFRLPFVFATKKISLPQIKRLLTKGQTLLLKGFQIEGERCEGVLRLNEAFELVLERKETVCKTSEKMVCPQCKKGAVVKGRTAYGCSEHAKGCDFRVSFEAVRAKAAGQALTKSLVIKIITAS